jgi:hypothetical protein
MNMATIAPEVQEFLATVRAQLADLDPDEQREILDGLEADLTDLVAERGGEALGDPVAYARELRAAAGLEPEMTLVRSRVPWTGRVNAAVDSSRARWDSLVERMPGDAAGLLAAMQPVWWVLRGWVAAEAVLAFGHAQVRFVPDDTLPGLVVFFVAVFLSVQVGRGRLWQGLRWQRLLPARLLLIGLNCAAVVLIPAVVDRLDLGGNVAYSDGWQQGYDNGVRDAGQQDGPKSGLYADGQWVSQVYPYDAKGRPLVGVQLFNQIGQPIHVVTQPEYTDDIDNANEGRPRIYYPWTNGAAQLFNVFPIPSRLQDSEEPSPTAFSEKVPPAITPYPFARVPEVSLPGIESGRQPVEVASGTPDD